MEFNKEELAKLPPKERLKKLKELEEEAKRQLEETKKVIQESEKMLKTSEVEVVQEEIKKEKTTIRTRDELKDISRLLRKRAEDLEALADEAFLGAQGSSYQPLQPQEAEVVDLYNRVKEIQASYGSGSGLSYDRVRELSEIKQKAQITHEYTQVSENIQKVAFAAQRIAEDVLGSSYIDNLKYTS